MGMECNPRWLPVSIYSWRLGGKRWLILHTRELTIRPARDVTDGGEFLVLRGVPVRGSHPEPRS